MSMPNNSVTTDIDSGDVLKKQIDNIENLSEISKNSRTTFLTILLACIYSFLTIGSTTDASLLSNSIASPLPIIQTKVPIIWFYYFAPLILFLLFIYFHLYLHRFWRCVAALPLYHPDGRSLDDYVYPWLVSAAFLRAEIPELRSTKKFRLPLESGLSIFMSWWIVPITLAFFWARYLVVHDWSGTLLHIVTIVISVGAAVRFYYAAKDAIHNQRPNGRIQKILYHRELIAVSAAIFTAGTLFYISFGAIEGAPDEECEKESIPECSILYSGARILDLIGYDPFVDLEGRALFKKPDDWLVLITSANAEERLKAIDGPSPVSRDLRFANASGAFLARSDLTRADLRRALLDGAILAGADLSNADLTDASLAAAQLQWANLTNAKLINADLNQANLQHSRLENANFEKSTLDGTEFQSAIGPEAKFVNTDLRFAKFMGAEFPTANLEDAYLYKADLTGAVFDFASFDNANLERATLNRVDLSEATFRNANLQKAKMKSAELFKAEFHNADLSRAKLSSVKALQARFTGADLTAANLRDADLRNTDFTDANLTDVDFSSADLTMADLSRANLVGADFSESDLFDAVFKGSDLSGADLAGANGVTQDQLNESCGDVTTKLRDGLTVRQCPSEKIESGAIDQK